MTTHEVVVIGGGIAGLATAYALRGRDVVVLEGNPRAGGNIRTLRRDGCTIDLGPDALIVQPSAALDLCEELGVEGIAAPSENTVLVAHRGELHPLPEGLAFGVPRSFAAIARTRLVSPGGKLRAGLDLVLPARDPKGVGLGVLIERRLGREVRDTLVEPLISGVYGGELDRLDPAVVMPALASVRGSYIRALSRGPRASGSPFRAPRGGMDLVVDALTRALGPESVVTGAAASMVRRDGHDFVIESARGSFRAKRVVLAVPPRDAASLLHRFDTGAAAAMGELKMRSSASVVMAFERQRGTTRGASGMLVSRAERRSFVAATFVNEKWPDRVAPDLEVIRAVVSADRAPELLGSSDDAVAARVIADLRAYLRLGPLRWSVVERFAAAAPIPELGQRAHALAIRERLRCMGVLVAGAAWDGPGIAGCVRGAHAVATELATSLSHRDNDRRTGDHRGREQRPPDGVQRARMRRP